MVIQQNDVEDFDSEQKVRERAEADEREFQALRGEFVSDESTLEIRTAISELSTDFLTSEDKGNLENRLIDIYWKDKEHFDITEALQTVLTDKSFNIRTIPKAKPGESFPQYQEKSTHFRSSIYREITWGEYQKTAPVGIKNTAASSDLTALMGDIWKADPVSEKEKVLDYQVPELEEADLDETDLELWVKTTWVVTEVTSKFKTILWWKNLWEGKQEEKGLEEEKKPSPREQTQWKILERLNAGKDEGNMLSGADLWKKLYNPEAQKQNTTQAKALFFGDTDMKTYASKSDVTKAFVEQYSENGDEDLDYVLSKFVVESDHTSLQEFDNADGSNEAQEALNQAFELALEEQIENKLQWTSEDQIDKFRSVVNDPTKNPLEKLLAYKKVKQTLEDEKGAAAQWAALQKKAERPSWKEGTKNNAVRLSSIKKKFAKHMEKKNIPLLMKTLDKAENSMWIDSTWLKKSLDSVDALIQKKTVAPGEITDVIREINTIINENSGV